MPPIHQGLICTPHECNVARFPHLGGVKKEHKAAKRTGVVMHSIDCLRGVFEEDCDSCGGEKKKKMKQEKKTQRFATVEQQRQYTVKVDPRLPIPDKLLWGIF
jgi:hypothetical protein